MPDDLSTRLQSAVKAYDVRATVPETLDEHAYRMLGAGFAVYVAKPDSGAIVIGHDMRESSPALAAAFADGAASCGVDVTLIGLASTDGLYFASGVLRQPGAMITASHNPAGENGLKLCRAEAVPIGLATGLADIRDLAVRFDREGLPESDVRGAADERSMLASYARHLQSLVPLNEGRPLRVVVDAGNGMAGLTVPEVLSHDSLALDPMYFELDGSFPNHPANPLDRSTLVDLQQRVVEVGADVGLAFDGDADRCVVVDEQGRVVDPSALTALVAARLLRVNPGAKIIYNVICSRAVPEVILEQGGTPVRSRVGHSFIKGLMAQTGAVFGGEHSGHYYFSDFWRADSGLLAALHLLDELQHFAGTVSALVAPFDRYVASGEVNSRVDDVQAVLDRVRAAFAGDSITFDDLDGLTVSHPDWWFNLRPSNTEPLLRLNAEAGDPAAMAELRERVLSLVRGGEG